MGGALHQATMVGQCAKDDAACSRKGPLAPLAVGAHFFPEVDTDVAGTTTPNLRLESAEPSIVAIVDGALVAKQPGAAAVLISTDDGSVIDFIHVWVSPVTSMTLQRRDGERIADTLGLAMGEDITLVPSLFNGAQKLAGSADVVWTSSSDAVSILRDGSPDRRRIKAHAPGKTTLTVALGDAKTSIDLEVLP